MTSLQSHLQLAITVLVRITLANNLKHLVPSEIYCFRTIVKNLVQVCQISQILENWGFILWILVVLTECSAKVMWYVWGFLFFNLVFALYLIQAPKLTASKYLNQAKSKEVLNRQAVRAPATPGRSGSSRSTIGHLPRTHRVTALPNYAKRSARLLPQSVSPAPAQGSAGDRENTSCAGVGLGSSLQCRPCRLGMALAAQGAQPCSEGLWVSQGGAQGWPDSATMGWRLELSPAGAEVCHMNHGKQGMWPQTGNTVQFVSTLREAALRIG